MLKTGAEHLESIRDGRVVYVGSERIDDVTTHPAFRAGAETVAALYDMKRAPENLDTCSYEEDGERYSNYYLRPRSQDDLRKRTHTHKAIADFTCGLFGRSPDHVAGLITGLACKPAVLEAAGKGRGDNVLRHFDKMRKEDSYGAFAVVPPPGTRDPDIHSEERRANPGLHVVEETDDGVVISGMKMLATGAVYANEILIGNLTPLAPEFSDYAITTFIPCNAPGLALWSRKPYAENVHNEFDYPFSARFDENDAVVVCNRVKVPWEMVFVHGNAELSRNCYIQTSANCFSNHQSNVRFWSKLWLITGLASRVTQSTGVDKIPAVREILGRLCALEAAMGSIVHGQIEAYEPDFPGDGYVCFNRRYMYAGLNYSQEMHSEIIDVLRGLMGGNPLQMPGDASTLADPALRKEFEDYFGTPYMDPIKRWKLLKLAWDLTGSEFAGRHQLYERFYAGTSTIVRSQNSREAPWDTYHALVDRLVDEIPTPKPRDA